jgi:hypothetical protein
MKWRPSNLALKVFLPLIIILLAQSIAPASAQVSVEKSVQIIEGHLETGDSHFYFIPQLKAGQTLFVYTSGESGDLDPIIGLLDANADINALSKQFHNEIETEVQAGNDPVVTIKNVSNKTFLIWDDDSGSGYDAAIKYNVPSDGEYKLIITSSPINPSFGDYRLQIGINAPEVLQGKGKDTGDQIAYLDQNDLDNSMAIQEIRGTLSEKNNNTFYYINDMDAGTTFSAFVEPTSGNLIPTLILKDFGDKPVRSGNYLGKDKTAYLQYTFNEPAKNYVLEISSCQKCDEATTGDFRLLVGRNISEKLSTESVANAEDVLRLPIQVKIGVEMDQITGVDQKAENFSVVANIIMKWQDPDLAFSPDTCDCNIKAFTGNNFNQFVTYAKDKWPEFSITNQQGNRWTQNKVVAVEPDGSAIYLERFTTTMQAPDFYFRLFPFDKQDFYIRLQSVFPVEYFVYTNPDELSKIGTALGEEEWVIIESDTTIDSVTNQSEKSRYNFHFKAKRRLTYYFLVFFIPLALIIIVSWITFFLKDYTRRIEVTTGNLLLFIAWNFSISDNLPRLGYMTFMDTVMATTFLISVIVVVFNVVLRRLEVTGKDELALKLDKFTIWIYPISYIVMFGLLIFLFFVVGI